MELYNKMEHPKTPREYARLFFSGMAMGAADIVPGVSGGTMAFILGIYETLLNSIKSTLHPNVIKLALTLKIKELFEAVPWRFLLPLGLGIMASILSMSAALSNLLENEPEFLFAFFFGLVLASIIAIGAKVEKWTPATIGGLVVASVGAFILVGLTPTTAPAELPNLFFAGVIAIMAMILPGISGSFILLLMGQYENVLNAVKNFEFDKIIAVALGCLVGIAGFSRVLSWLLARYEQITIAILTGFMIGSLRKIWPFRVETQADHAEEFTKAVNPFTHAEFTSTEILIAFGLCLAGFILVTAIDHMQSRSNPVVVLFTGRKAQQVEPVA
jgi:putative membrane protein